MKKDYKEENYAINCNGDGYNVRVTSNGAMRFIYQNHVDPGYGCLAIPFDNNEIDCD